jgi:hypothetical protein
VSKRTMNRLIRIPIALAALSATLLALPGTADAAPIQWNTIAGTTYNDSSKWYVSSTYRLKEFAGYVDLDFAQLPKAANGTVSPIKWRFIGNQGEILGGHTYTISDLNNHGTEYIGSNAQFRNSYARYYTCTLSACTHNFSGHEWY